MSAVMALISGAAPQRNRLGRRTDVQVLRALAITAVVWDHFEMPGPIFGAGFRGVDVFFVISGFVITLSIAKRSMGVRTMSATEFFTRRIQRLYPAFFIVVAATIAVLAATRWIPEMEVRSAEAGIAGTWFGQNIWLLNQQISYFSPSFPNPFTHLWSLGVEEQFYIVAGLGLAALGLLRIRTRRWLWLPVTGATVASYAACLYYGNPDWLPDDGVDRDFLAFYLPHLRAWQILLGVLVGMAAARGTSGRSSTARSSLRMIWAVSAVAIVYGLFVRETTAEGINSVDFRVRTLATIACVGTAILLLVGPRCAWPDRIASSPIVRLIGAIGDRSYVLYLVHWPVVLIQSQVWPALPHPWSWNLAITLVLAEILHRGVEGPALRWPVGSRRLLAAFAAGQLLLTGTMLWYRAVGTERASHRPSQEVFFTKTDDCGALVMPFRCTVRRSDRAIFVEGDSHAQMVLPEILGIASRRGLGVEANMQMGGYDFEYFTTDLLEASAESVILIWFHHDQDPLNIEGRVLRHLERTNVAEIVVVLDTPSMASWHLEPIDRRVAEAQRNPDLITRISVIASRDDRVRLVDPLDAICDRDQCPVLDGADILYSDEHHLSWAGAALLRPWLDGLIASAFE